MPRDERSRAPVLAAVPDLEAELDALYGAPLERFTATRDDLARRLRRAGQAEHAAAVAALRKPSPPVWRVNRLVRTHPQQLAALLEAGERLEGAQTGRGRGGSTAEAARAHREALERLAAELDDLGAEARRRAVAALRLGSLEPAARAQLAAGRLAAEPESAGFDLVARLGVAPTRPVSRRRASARPEATDAALRAERLREARGAARTLRKALAAAEREAEDARRAAEQAAARVEQLAAELAERERALDALQARYPRR